MSRSLSQLHSPRRAEALPVTPVENRFLARVLDVLDATAADHPRGVTKSVVTYLVCRETDAKRLDYVGHALAVLAARGEAVVEKGRAGAVNGRPCLRYRSADPPGPPPGGGKGGAS